jgi:simple sugar transport system ATP-binding protein
VLANDTVDFQLRKGEIHGLLGENGAGKTTLMNVIYGLYTPEEGQIHIEGSPVEIHSPNDAIRAGIGMVHQHFMLVPVFTVAENIVLGSEVTRGPTLDMRSARREIRELSKEFGLEVDPRAVIEDLPVGIQQRVEIVKALYRKARILILDEPTAVLTPQEAKDLFRVMRNLTERGVSIVFITHKLKEVLAIADRVTVMRRGRVVGTTAPEHTSQEELASMMVGREVLLQVEKGPPETGETVLAVEDLRVADEHGTEVVKGVSFRVRAGEVLGIAGVQGNGQTELVEALTGLRPARSGKVTLGGEQIRYGDPRFLIEHGMAHVPEDRHKHGLVLPYTVADNFVLCTYYKPPFAQGLQRQPGAVVRNAIELIESFDVRTPGPMVTASTLSGGNQQKVIVGRELSRPVRLLVANQPTRGLDVGSIEYIHRRIIEIRDSGCAVLLISSELDEVMQLSDRIGVMYQGEIVAKLEAERATKEHVGLLMAGASPEAERSGAAG